MGKKIDETEVKKECPSCGLGVALDSSICEFCGWDFEEEDEWILQIEKLERDLMLEKQRFEPGSVNQRIESTLHAPALGRKETAKAAPRTMEPVQARETRPAPKPAPPVARDEHVLRRARPSEVRPQEVPPPVVAKEEAADAKKVRRVRTVKAAPTAEAVPQASDQGETTMRTRVVRKVKQ
ncbi:MAG: hypothetical protein ABIE25_00665 [Thermoplasmatota archaeon]|nr:hypothetical protein [Candidatus Thermoplasmatota archaeon]MBU1914855.1 hypothetical protein [Candidatus Thermoplasmatota archaeon]